MLRLYKDVKSQLARVAGQTGLTVGDPKLIEFVNLAQERLANRGNWPVFLKRLQVRIHDGILVMPDEFEAAQSVWRDGIGSLQLTDPWFNLSPQATIPGHYTPVTAEDRGETYAYRHPLGLKIKAYSEDSDDITITADHETVTITPGNHGSEPALTAKGYHYIKRIERASGGKKPFEIVYENEDGEEFFGARFSGYWAHTPFRHYTVGSSTDDEVVEVVGRRRVIPVVDDNSPMVITNVNALRLGLMAIAKEDAGQIDEAEANLIRATEVLKEENKSFHPHNQQPRISFGTGFGDIPKL